MSGDLRPAMIQFSKLDLGRKREDYDCPVICGGKTSNKVVYPSLYVHGTSNAIDLPAKGKAIVDYKVISRTTRERDGKAKHDADIEIHAIEPIEEKKPKKLPGSATSLNALHPGMIQFSRARNSMGQYAPESSGGLDPDTMANAYNPGAIAKTGAAAAGVTGAALLGLALARRVGRRAKV